MAEAARKESFSLRSRSEKDALWPMSQLNVDGDAIAAHMFQAAALCEEFFEAWTMRYWCGQTSDQIDISVPLLDRLCLAGMNPTSALQDLMKPLNYYLKELY